ncbi:MAG: diguanylate cyclase [Xenococcaceae cyanobacterium MO_188.B19]|nr:diguanylate cyclase [Xenococcaceae cyanobacterium MO_188.B19]
MQLKTLLVEDDPEYAFLLQEQLARADGIQFDITHVEKLTSAIKCLKQKCFEIILLDIGLPDSQGLETFLSLKEIALKLPIVLLTGLKDESLALEAVRQGAQDYLVKQQITTDILIRSINYAVERMYYFKKIHQRRLYLQQTNRELARQVKNCTFELERQNRQLQKLFLLSTTDKLTGIANRVHFEDFLQREWGNAIRNQTSLSIIMIDIDNFKLYNDTYGHLEGDRCLQQVAQTINVAVKRPKDLVARYGGEELIVILPDINLDGAEVVANNIRSQVKALNIPHASSQTSDRLTISLGVASLIPALNSEASSLILAADAALYLAKQKGRDRIEIYQNQLKN